jgi:hypothetical protein
MLTNEQRDSLLNARPERSVTVAQIESRIKNKEFSIHAGSTLTICVLTLENGFTVVGKSACAHPDNFNQELGEKIAYDDAFKQIWPLEGYLLREALHLEQQKQQAA